MWYNHCVTVATMKAGKTQEKNSYSLVINKGGNKKFSFFESACCEFFENKKFCAEKFKNHIIMDFDQILKFSTFVSVFGLPCINLGLYWVPFNAEKWKLGTSD